MTAHRCLLLLACSASCFAAADECAAVLQRGLEAHNPDTRKQAVVALSLASARSPLMPLLEGMLQDKDVEVRLAVVASLAELKTRGATEALRKALDDEVPEVSFAAAKVLWLRRDPEGRKALLAVLEGESKTTSGFFTLKKREALRMLHTPGTTLMFALRTGASFAPVPGLGQGLASMQALLMDPAVSGRATAALLLGNDADRASLDALRDALTDKDWRVRAAAVHSLALRNDPGLRRDLDRALADDKEEVRLRAAAACLRFAAISGARRQSH